MAIITLARQVAAKGDEVAQVPHEPDGVHALAVRQAVQVSLRRALTHMRVGDEHGAKPPHVRRRAADAVGRHHRVQMAAAGAIQVGLGKALIQG